jgi:hypothetical protein
MYAQNRKIGKPNNFKTFGSNKSKGHTQDIQNLLRSPTPREGKVIFHLKNTYFGTVMFNN